MRLYNGNDGHDLEKLLDPYVRQIADDFGAFLNDVEPVDADALDRRVHADIERQRRIDHRAGARRNARNIAAALLLTMTVCMGALVAVGAIELPPFGDWFLQLFTDRGRVNSADLAYLQEQGIEYAPLWLPDGYSFDGATGRDALLNYSRLTFSNEQGQMGFLDHIDGDMPVSYDVEHDGAPVKIGEHDGYLSVDQGTRFLFWRMAGDSFVLVAPDDVDAVRIAESVQSIVP